MVMIYDVPFNFYFLLSRQNNDITNETVFSKKRVAGAVKLETYYQAMPFMVLLASTTKKERGRIGEKTDVVLVNVLCYSQFSEC